MNQRNHIYVISPRLRFINILFKFSFPPNFRFLTILHWVFSQDLAWGKSVNICILCNYVLLPLWRDIFQSYWYNTPNEMSCSIKCNFYILYWLGLLDTNIFVDLFLDQTQGSNYYWHCGSFKIPHLYLLILLNSLTDVTYQSLVMLLFCSC